MRARYRVLHLVGGLLLAGCGTETVVHNLDEREANQILELFADSEIVGTKGMVDTGRTVVFSVAVPPKSRMEAVKLLNRFEMPRRRDMGYNEVFKESGLIPTAGQEKAKLMASLEGEIEKQLKLVDGILDVQVQLVLPEESALRTSQEVRAPTTASVTIKYMPSSGGSKPLSEPQVQAIVAAGVERLTADNVVVVMTPGGPVVRAGDRGMAAAGDRPMLPMGSKNMRVIGAVLCGLIILLCLGLSGMWLRLKTVRSRLSRLQSEIAKARRKPNGDMAPPGP